MLQATCSDYDLNNPGLQGWPCPEGTANNSNAAMFSPPSNSRYAKALVPETHFCCVVSKYSASRFLGLRAMPALHPKACMHCSMLAPRKFDIDAWEQAC